MGSAGGRLVEATRGDEVHWTVCVGVPDVVEAAATMGDVPRPSANSIPSVVMGVG